MPALGYKKQFVSAVCLGLFNEWKEATGWEFDTAPHYENYCSIIGAKPEVYDFIPHGKIISDIVPKRQTIRAMRRYPIKKGDRLYHYYALRTKNCRKLGETICKDVQEIQITAKEFTISKKYAGKIITVPSIEILTEGITLSTDEANVLARQDGFSDIITMANFWLDTHSLPFKGQLIKW